MSDRPQDNVPAHKVVICASLSLAVMIVEFGWFMPDEVKYVWPRLRASWSARTYMLARYIGMACQIFSVCFTVRMYLGVHTSPAGCRLWFAYQALVVQLLLALVQYLLMHRIYALFLRRRTVLLLLGSFALSQVASMGVSAHFSFVANEHTVTCLMVRSNPGNAFFSTTTMMIHLTIFFMTIWQYVRLPAAFTRGVFGWMVFRDLAASLGAISLTMFFMTLCSLEVIKPAMSGNITYYWLVCILWISIGRITVNHERMRSNKDGEQEQGDRNTWNASLQLTSQIEMGEGEWTLTLGEALFQSGRRASSHGPTAASSTLRGSLQPPPRNHSRSRPCTDADALERGNGQQPNASQSPSPPGL